MGKPLTIDSAPRARGVRSRVLRTVLAALLTGSMAVASGASAAQTGDLKSVVAQCMALGPALTARLTDATVKAGFSMNAGHHFALEIPVSGEDSLSSVEVWIEGRQAVLIGAQELSMMGGDGRVVRVPFVTAHLPPEGAPVHPSVAALSDEGVHQIALAAGQRSSVTFVVHATIDGKARCGAPAISFSMGNLDTFAIVIGFNYSQPDYQLRYAVKDAAAVARHLIDDLGTKEENIWLFSDDAALGAMFPKAHFQIPAKAADIERAYEAIQKTADRRSRVYLYFSGHMVLPEQVSDSAATLYADPLFLLPKSDLEDRRTMIRRDEMLNLIRNSGFAVAVILDACYSGTADAEYPSGGSVRPNGTKRVRQVRRALAGELDVTHLGARITSSKADQASWELEEFQHGVFTYYLLNAGKDRAELSLMDAFKHARDQMSTLRPSGWGDKPFRQTPTEISKDGSGIPWKIKR